MLCNGIKFLHFSLFYVLLQLDERAADTVMQKIFKNYKNWCKFLGRKHNLRLPQSQPEIQQRKIIYMGLYLLIWGEAANVRFMPECLCYIFHNMAYELHGLLAGNVSIVTGENIKPSYGGDDEAFLRKVIAPIYRVIAKEASKSQNGTASSTEGHPIASLLVGQCVMMVHSSNQHVMQLREKRLLKKILEARENHILLKLEPSGTYSEALTDCGLFMSWPFRVCSYNTKCILDLVLNFPGYHRWKFTDVLRNIMKIIVSFAWAVILPLCYSGNFKQVGGFTRGMTFLRTVESIPPIYLFAVVIYMIPNILAACLFIFPMLRRWIENSDWLIVRFLLWWSQVYYLLGLAFGFQVHLQLLYPGSLQFLVEMTTFSVFFSH
ncbi:Callose synthase 5 [Linum grandiflorum]